MGLWVGVTAGLVVFGAVIPIALQFSSSSSHSNNANNAASRISADILPNVDPCDDFYKFACGGYETRNADSTLPIVTPLVTMQQKVNEELRQILDSQPSADDSLLRIARRLRLFYKSCLASKSLSPMGYVTGRSAMNRMVDDLGGFCLKAERRRNVSALSFTEQLAKVHSKYTMNVLFTLTVMPNPYKVTQHAIVLQQPASMYVNELSVDEQKELAVLVSPAQRSLFNITDIVGSREVKSTLHDLLQKDKNNATYLKPVDLSWLKDKLPSIDWDLYFRRMLTAAEVSFEINNSTPIVLIGGGYFEKLGMVLGNWLSQVRPKRKLHNYLVFQAVFEYQADFGVGANGDDAADDDDEHVETECVARIRKFFDIPLGALFVDKHFASLSRSRDRVQQILDNLVTAYERTIAESTWLDVATKEGAIDKLRAMKILIGFEPWIRNDSFVYLNFLNLDFNDDFADNVLAAYRYAFVQANLENLLLEPDLSKFALGPANVQAYNLWSQNKLAVLAAILSEPVFEASTDVPLALSYGALGSIVGHEMTHAFDFNGQKFDKFGNRMNWWLNNKTLERYDKRSSCFAVQFSAYSSHRFPIDGYRTLAENIADSTGLSVAYRAYRIAANQPGVNEDAKAAALEGVNLSPEQLFFFGYARWLCTVYRDKKLLETLATTDEHALHDVRVKGAVRNSDAFAKAFNCSVNKWKCEIW